MIRSVFAALGFFLLVASATPAQESGAGPWFAEVAGERGLDFLHASSAAGGFHLPEILGGGVALLDHDGDGDLDVYLVQSGGDAGGNRLFANRGDGTFADVTADAGVGHTGYGMGATCADYDGDGHVDVFVTNFAGDVLYRNGGDGTFRDETARLKLVVPGWTLSSAFVDYDGDGRLDLFAAGGPAWSTNAEGRHVDAYGRRRYVAPGELDGPTIDTLLRNTGRFGFRDVTTQVGLDVAVGSGCGVTWADVDGDGRPEIFVAGMGSPGLLWRHAEGDALEEVAVPSGCAAGGEGAVLEATGAQLVDLDDDGDPDLVVGGGVGRGVVLFENAGGFFSDRSRTSGIAVATRAFAPFGLGCADFDNDGVVDLYVANGALRSDASAAYTQDPHAQPNQVFRGLGGLRFEELAPRGGTAAPVIGTSRGVALGDLDDDGDVDVVVVERDGPVRFLENRVGDRRHWAAFRVRAGKSDALGARVRLRAGGREQWRSVQVAYGALASHDPRVHFGLGDAAEVTDVTVFWPDGTEEAFGARVADRYQALERGAGTAR